MRAAIYARKSQSQEGVAEEARSVAAQVHECREFVARKGWALEDRNVYTDDGVSGGRFEGRDQLQRMLRDAEARAFDCLVYHAVDRVGRIARKTRAVLDRLDELGVALYDMSRGEERLDTGSFASGLMTDMETRFAEWYREQCRTKTRTALAHKFGLGHATGKPPYGFRHLKLGPKHTVREFDEAEAKVVREMFALYAAGASPGEIMETLNRRGVRNRGGKPWSLSTVEFILHNSIYLGRERRQVTRVAHDRELPRDRRTRRDGGVRERGQVRRPEGEWAWRNVPAVIDEGTAARVMARLQGARERWEASVGAGRARPERAHGRHLLSGGLLVCGECGRNFEAREWGSKGRMVYVCSARRRRRGTCPSRLVVDMEAMDEVVLSTVEAEALSPSFREALLASLADATPDAAAALQAERDRLKAEVERLVQAVAKGSLDDEDAGKVIRGHKAEITRIEARTREAEAAPKPTSGELREVLERNRLLFGKDLRGETRTARLVLRKLIGQIVMSDIGPAPEWVKEWRRTNALPRPGEPSSGGGGGRPAFWRTRARTAGLLEGTGLGDPGRDGHEFGGDL